MQPNQQDPNQQPLSSSPPPNGGYVSPSGSTVPDFLQMDPIAPQGPPKSNKLKKFIIIFTGIILILVAGVVAYLYFVSGPQSDSANEKRFYTALENLMQTSYVHREYKVETKEPTQASTIVAETDLSNPTLPKSAIKFSEDMGDDGSGVKKYDGEYRVIQPGEYAGLLTSATKNATPKGISLNQWYKFANDTKQNKTIERRLNSFESRSTINTPQGPVIMGNIKEDFRLQLMELIKTKGVYIIDANQTKINDNESVLQVAVNSEALNELNKRVADLYSLGTVLKISATTADKMQVHINNATSKVTKVIYTNTDLYKKTVDFTYPESVEVTYPENIKDTK